MQNYKNHTRYFPLHHFLITPLTLIIMAWSLVNLFTLWETKEISQALYNILIAFVLLLLPVLARIYALKTQDRIIRLEMRQRYFELTGTSFLKMEKKLRMSQIIALRFAGDEELIPLMEKAVKDKLKSNEIKKSIQNWQEDRRRV
ncbi:hypothetical protein SAMN00777080_3220 [Aquiflexum balticum DSM 16537]|uniref:Uncharacterized protein n=1 Tax=Aquiflexum balticum DSM 16537 TaxID=758820 RepID=A0A1W2H7S5_9BACT|nr:DUF6526 family protein [Aquiflexum balticum]SMD44596.1 hypothetical protein SAMN00777080_3220 [Aquiflexum balticum DSM 16537]